MSYNLNNYYCSCLNINIPTCYSTYQFQVEYSNYVGNFVIYDKFNKLHIITANVDNDGNVILDASLLPDNFFNEYSRFKLEFWIDVQNKDNFVSGSNMFSCLYLNFYKLFTYDVYSLDLSIANQIPYVCCCADISINCNENE